jgi:hypothetical protein
VALKSKQAALQERPAALSKWKILVLASSRRCRRSRGRSAWRSRRGRRIDSGFRRGRIGCAIGRRGFNHGGWRIFGRGRGLTASRDAERQKRRNAGSQTQFEFRHVFTLGWSSIGSTGAPALGWLSAPAQAQAPKNA